MKIILIIFLITIAYLLGMAKFEQYMSIDNLKYNTYSSSNYSANESDSSTTIMVKLTGQVNNQKSVVIESGSTLGEIIDLCGGLKLVADTRCINLDYVVEKSMDIFIPELNITTTKISLNESTIDELMKLPKIGEVYAARIIEHRDIIGGFMCLEQLKDIQGIGPSIFDAIKNSIIL